MVEFEKNFSKRNLEKMRKFYVCFPIATTVSSQLSWSHYLELIKEEQRIQIKLERDAKYIERREKELAEEKGVRKLTFKRNYNYFFFCYNIKLYPF